MHECPFCGTICDCDGEDLFYSIPPEDCLCECEDFEEDFDLRWEDEDDFCPYDDFEVIWEWSEK